jgi:hypothetical protein
MEYRHPEAIKTSLMLRKVAETKKYKRAKEKPSKSSCP